MSIKVLLADDHKMIREGLKQLLELDDNIEVICEAENGEQCLRFIESCNPDIVLLDINMPGMDGLKTLVEINKNFKNVKVIMLTIHKEMDYIVKAVEKGCHGYVLKDSGVAVLKDAIFETYAGKIYIEPELLINLNKNLAMQDQNKKIVESLTRREIEILKLVAQGMFNKQIGIKLEITERTVKNHVASIFKKIGVVDRTQAAVFAIKNNIINVK